MYPNHFKKNKASIISFLFLILCFALFLYENIKGLGFLRFTDESGHFVGAQAIHKGDKLYRDYIDYHGPVIYMLTWMMGLIVGFSEVWLLRLISSFSAMLAALCLFFSPIFHYFWQRYLVTALWFGFISSVWLIQGLYLDNYWTLGGCFAAIGLVTLVIPMIYDIKPSRIQAFTGGFFITLLPFIAYPFAITAFILFLVVINGICIDHRKYVSIFVTSLSGCLTSIIMMLVWLGIYGDIGGMVAFHFITNQMNYARYIPFNLSNFFLSLIPSFSSNHIVETFALFSFCFGGIILVAKGKYKISACLVLCGILGLQARGSILFQNGAFLIASVTLIIVAFVKSTEVKPDISLFFSVISTFCIFFIIDQYAVTSPNILDKRQRNAYQWHAFREGYNEDTKAIWFYVDKNERILSIPYNPDIYILANRLPIKKYHAYLPWEADYASHPWHHYERDLCKDLPKNKPPLIYYDPSIIWGKYMPDQFLSCVLIVLKNDYTHIATDSYIYVRNDRYRERGKIN